eukprot:CAMPEP_0178917298 /NCGR_PEP_ID=MMETSP0786-20121207/13168_1 /TAXON_ID=186022 /ORGANISM="Thalassionema frauenfeldii, Strain CCMP 1798" /LENGTH=257 /DNA_ID=CAMNT_0020590831 /DNA_START=154 /DNA_END=927 /DNA_ORIENTATION=-
MKISLYESDESDADHDQHNTAFVMWPSAVMLSRYIAQHPSILQDGGDILELGAGCGLVGLTAARLLQEQEKEQISNPSTVIFTDYNPVALENIQRNIRLNELEHVDCVGLDFFDQIPDDDDTNWKDMSGQPRPQVSLILGADLMAYSNDATLVANSIQTALAEGGKALIYSPAKGTRFGVADFPEACYSLGLDVEETTTNAPTSSLSSSSNQEGEHKNEDSNELLQKELEKSGYEGRNGPSGYDFTMFTVTKPVTTS